MQKIYLFILLICSFVFTTPVFAATPATDAIPPPVAITPIDVSIINVITLAIASSAKILMTKAPIWLGAFISIQFIITMFGTLKSGADIEAVIGKVIGSMVWFGFCVYLIQSGPGFIHDVGNQMFDILGMTWLTPGPLIASALFVGTGLFTISGAVAAVPAIGTGPGIILFFIALPIFLAMLYIALKIFMLQLELILVVMLSPLSFAFLGLNALKDQGIAPFKSLISLAYRILLMSVIMGAYSELITAAKTIITSYSGFTGWFGLISDIWILIKTIGSLAGAFIVLSFLVYKSDSIAASLAGGSTGMGTGDIASAVGAGVAGGMAVAAAGAAAAAGVAKIPSAAGSVSNAGGTGSGNPQSIPDPTALSSLTQPSGGSLDSQMQTVAASEKAMATGSVGETAGSTSVDGVTSGGGDTGGGKSAPFSKVDGAKAAGAVPATASQNTKNAAAVGAAMRASGAHENMAALAESMAEQGSGASEISNACCNSPEQTAAVGNAMAGAAEVGGGAGDPGWLGSGSAVSPGGSGAGAGIGNGGADTASPTATDHLANFGKRMGEMNQHLEKEKAATHVSISTHSSD